MSLRMTSLLWLKLDRRQRHLCLAALDVNGQPADCLEWHRLGKKHFPSSGCLPRFAFRSPLAPLACNSAFYFSQSYTVVSAWQDGCLLSVLPLACHPTSVMRHSIIISSDVYRCRRSCLAACMKVPESPARLCKCTEMKVRARYTELCQIDTVKYAISECVSHITRLARDAWSIKLHRPDYTKQWTVS